MATVKEVKVVIAGEETVSSATKKVEGGLDKLTTGFKQWATGFLAFTALWHGLKAVVSAVTETIQDSLRAYDELEKSQRKLEGTSKLTGIALEDLNVVAEIGKRAFGLSTVVARDFATEIGKLGDKAGDTTKSKEALQAFLDIGAARGLTATETLQALQQSLLGIDEGTDKLFGKNPSGLWADYESVIGKTASKFDDADKAAALLHAALEGGTKVLGDYADFLDTTAGRADQLAQRTEEAKSKMGMSLDGMREAYLDAAGELVPGFFDRMRREIDNLNNSIEGWKAVTFGALAAIAQKLGNDKAFVEYSVKAVDAAKKADEWARTSAMSAEELAESTRKYGGSLRDVIPNIDKTKDSLFAVKNPLDAFTKGSDDAADAVGKVGPKAKMSKEEVEAYTRTTWKSAEDVAKAKKAEEKAWDEHVAKLKAWYRILSDEVVSYKEVLKTMQPALDRAFDLASIKGHNQALRDVQASADAAVEAMKKHGDLPPLVKNVEREVKGLSDELLINARTALDVGDAFGVIDDEAKVAFTSTMNVADAISKMMTGGVTFAGVAAVVGGVASIVTNMMQGDRERRELTRKNTEALDNLRRDGVRLSQSASGDQISGLAGVLTPDLVNALKGMTTEAGRGAGNQILVQALAKAGLRLSDLDAVANDLGLNLRRSNGQIDLAQLPLLLQALQGGGTDLTNIGNSFSEKLGFFREGQDLRGVTGTAGAQGLLDFLTQQGVGAFAGIDLSNPAAARQQLLDLFDKLGTPGGIDPGLLGPASGQQLRDLIGDLIRSLGDGTSSGTGGGDTGGGGGGGGGGTGEGGDEGGGGIAFATLQTVVDGIQAQTDALGAFHVASLGYLSRTADATEATAQNTAVALEYLEIMVKGAAGSGNTIDETLGRQISVDQRLQGRSIAT